MGKLFEGVRNFLTLKNRVSGYLCLKLEHFSRTCCLRRSTRCAVKDQMCRVLPILNAKAL